MIAACSGYGIPKMLMTICGAGSMAGRSGTRSTTTAPHGLGQDHFSARPYAVPGGEPGSTAVGPRFQRHARSDGPGEAHGQRAADPPDTVGHPLHQLSGDGQADDHTGEDAEGLASRAPGGACPAPL